jgi:next to BRCA1 gene 1 protein
MDQQTRHGIVFCMLGLLVFVLTGCGTSGSVTPFIAPTQPIAAPQTDSPTPPQVTFAPQPTAITPASSSTETSSTTQTPQPIPTSTPSGPCNNSLLFVQDLTVADGTVFAPGAAVDKRWLVANVGTCNWDTLYRLRVTNGIDLSAAPEQALYPARGGTQAVIRIVFTAPQTDGTYRSEWQAYAPDGSPFGNPIYVEIVVQSP